MSLMNWDFSEWEPTEQGIRFGDGDPPGRAGRISQHALLTRLFLEPKRLGPRVGQLAPQFRLQSVRGGVHELASILGERRALLVFYHGSRCNNCSCLLGELARQQGAFEDMSAQVLAISNEPTRLGQELVDRFDPKFPLLMDPFNSVIAQYDLLEQRRSLTLWMSGNRADIRSQVVLLDRTGEIRWTERAHGKRKRLTAQSVLDAVDAARDRPSRNGLCSERSANSARGGRHS